MSCGVGGGIDAHAGGAGRGHAHVGRTPTDTPTEWTEVAYTVACGNNTPDSSPQVDGCAPAVPCTSPAVASWKWTRLVSQTDGPGGWENAGTVCHAVGAPPAKPRATLGQILNTAKHLPFDRATIETQPSSRTLVGLDTIFWTQVDDEYWDNVNVAGEHIDFRATPKAYVWNFGDGSAPQELGPGAAYPNQTVTHAYHRSNTSPQVVVTVRWRAEYRREDESVWRAVPELIDGFGVPRTLSVAPAHSQLLEGPR